MVFDLIKKEYISQSESRDLSFAKKILFSVIKLISAGLLVALEVFIFYSLDQKVSANSTSGTFDFLVLFLFITIFIAIIFTSLKARKILFNGLDKSILSPLPIDSGEVLFAKSLYLYIIQFNTNLLISSPILICYFVTRNYMPTFYVFGVVYSAIISLFGIGISLILSIVFEYCYRLLKLSDIAQFVFASILVVCLCFAYQIVLNLFLDALNTNEGTGMFSEALINLIHGVSAGLFPVYTILDPLIFGENLVGGICITIGMILASIFLGSILSSIAYSHINKDNSELFLKKKRNKNNLVLSPFKALIKKEFALLFKDSSYTFSYTSLLIMAPFLSFVVISSLNGIIYQNLRYFSVYFPDLVNGLNICLILLFTSVINSSASQSISREGRSLEIVKYIPIDPIKQVIAKVLIPVVLSSVSLLLTLIVLIASGNIDYRAFLITLFAGLVLITVTTVFGLYFDMRDKSSDEFKLSFINNLVSILFPFVILAIHFLVSLLRVDNYLIYVFEAATSLVLLIPLFIRPKKMWLKVFRRMEVE